MEHLLILRQISQHDCPDENKTKQVIIKLVLLEGEYFSRDAVLSDYLDLNAVARVDIPLSYDDENIFDNGHHFFHRQRLLLIESVLVSDLKRVISDYTVQVQVHKFNII